MSPYAILPHQADIRLSASGDSLEELFRAALDGMNEILKPGFCNASHAESVHDEIELSASDQTSLLIDFLSEILTRSQARRAVFCGVRFLELREKSLRAELSGSSVDGFSEDIKAVTYYGAEVQRDEQGWYRTIIVLDI